MTAVKNNGLDPKDYQIILTLEQNPSLSNARIAEKLGVAPETIRLRLRALKEKGVLRPDRTIKDPLLGKRMQTEAESAYLPSRLGLTRHHAIFTGIKSRAELNKLKKLCDIHPYTHYRVVAFGQRAALYTQFDIPPETEKTLVELYSELQKRGLCEDYLMLKSRYVSGGNAVLQRWDIESNKWDLDYGRKSAIGAQLSRLEGMWKAFLKEAPKEEPPETFPTHKSRFDKLDLVLLRELTVNARPSFKVLGQVYEKDPTTISRRIDRIREKFAPIDILYYDRSVFDLTYPQLIFGKFKEGDQLNARTFYWFLKSEFMPFESKGTSNGSEFILFTMTPPSFAPELSEFFWEHATDTNVFQLQLDASFTYYFYHENWSPTGGWRSDKDYILHEPLEAIEQK